MISTFTSARATRWAGGVLVVAASALGIGIGPAVTSASAASPQPPSVVTISPASATVGANGCSALTVFATQANNAPATGWVLTVQATESAAAGSTSPLAACSVTNGTPTTVLGNSVVGGSAGILGFGATPGTATLRFSATTDGTGEIHVGVSSSAAGSLSIVGYYQTTASNAAPATGNPTSNTEAVTVTTGGAASVTKVVVSPASQTQYVGSGASYTVAALDTNGNPVPGVGVDYTVSGPDPQTPVRQCGANTDSNGQATCTITNGGTVGTDTIVFYVNESGGTAGPDSGEPQATATATFQALPANGNLAVVATCSNTRVVAPPAGSCTNSTATHAVTFTATVTDTTTQAPVSGVLVTWGNRTITNGPTPADSSLSATSCTTGSAGTCTITVTEPNPQSGEVQQLTAAIGSSTSSTATAGWAASTPTYFAATPSLQTVTNGGSPTFTASVTDQFGAPFSGQHITFLVATGRNSGKTLSTTTGTNGKATFTYTDGAPTSSQSTDTVQVKDTDSTPGGPTNNTVSDTVNYISGSTQAGLIALDVSGNCNTASPTSSSTGTVGTTSTEVCALVTNSSGTKLLGKPVTFAVNIGRVDATATPSGTASPSLTVDTDANGVATVYVSSTTSGSQRVSAVSDSVSATDTVGYGTSVASLSKVSISPTPAAIGPGSTQTFTATATDASGNVVPGATLLFVQSGPGALNGGNNQLATTNASGTASVVLTTASTDSGTGSVTVSVQNAGATQCGATGGVCTAAASYTVKAGAGASTLLLFPQNGVVAGNGDAEGVEAVVLDGSGNPVANQVIRFTVTGANPGTGTATTNASGAAIFAYPATHSGTDSIAAYDDLNNNQVKDAGEPAATTTAAIAPAGTNPGGGKEHPTLTITQKYANSHQEKLTLKVTSNPKLVNATVTFYQVKKGVRHKIGPGETGKGGKVTGTLKAAHGLTLKFQVKVTGKAGVSSGYSKVVTVHVK